MIVMAIKVESRSKKILTDLLEHLSKGDVASLHANTYRDQLLIKDRNGDTAVHWAARLGRCVCLQTVLSPDVVSVQNNTGGTPLHEAAYRGVREEVQVDDIHAVRPTIPYRLEVALAIELLSGKACESRNKLCS